MLQISSCQKDTLFLIGFKYYTTLNHPSQNATLCLMLFVTTYCDFHLTENSDIIVLCKVYSTGCQALMRESLKFIHLFRYCELFIGHR